MRCSVNGLVLSIPAPALVVLTAIGYSVATFGMKSAAMGGVSWWMALCLGGFALALAAEVSLLRRSDLPIVYISIIAAETLMVLGYGFWIGEGLTLKQCIGAALVMAGLVAVTV